MSTENKAACQRCGAPIPASSTDQICPACLMSRALEGPTEGLTQTMPEEAGKPASETTVALDASPPHIPATFPQVFGNYRLMGLLGRGGMGAVYDAEHIRTGRRVALKILEHQLDSPDMRQRFLREGRLAASIRHPNSLYIFGSEETEGTPVITMEIAGSGTLKDKLKKQGPLPVSEAVDAILDVIAGLDAACSEGVLHRDIKPSNCFVSPDGSVKVGDYGLSVSTLGTEDSFVTATGVIMGTPAYASPEQLRGDALDSRADIYSVGATLFTLLTGQVPFEGKNAVQVVANAVNQKPRSLTELREDIPPVLAQIVNRCLAKDPEDRFPDYKAFREALLPFSSREPEAATLKMRMAAGWVDFLSAFLVPYLALMFSVSVVEFHFNPFIERTLYSAKYYFTFLSFGFLYFSLCEGIWGAGLGKWLFGLRVVRKDGHRPGILRSFLRIAIPILTCEIIRFAFLLSTLSVDNIQQISVRDNVLLIGASNVCPWFAALLTLSAGPKNGWATVWDMFSGTRVVLVPKAVIRPIVVERSYEGKLQDDATSIGPYEKVREWIPGKCIAAKDPVLRRPVWLIRREAPLSDARRHLARSGRLRWLQEVTDNAITWDAFEAPQGVPLSDVIKDQRIPWGTLRHWLHDLASELWAASRDNTLPAALSVHHIRITSQGAILLDDPDPETQEDATCYPVDDLASQQRFLSAIADYVDPTSIPLHARPIVENLKQGKFEKLSYLTGVLCGLLDKPAEVSKALRGMSIFMLPLYVGILLFVGMFDEATVAAGGFRSAIQLTLGILGTGAIIQFLALPLKWIWSHDVFGLVVVDADGKRAGIRTRLIRWMIVWCPLFVPIGLLWQLAPPTATTTLTAVILFLWLTTTIQTVIHPTRGIHDRLAGTWVVRR